MFIWLWIIHNAVLCSPETKGYNERIRWFEASAQGESSVIPWVEWFALPCQSSHFTYLAEEGASKWFYDELDSGEHGKW